MKNRIKKFLSDFISTFSPRTFFTIAYIHNRWRMPNFSHPKDLSEILVWQVLSGHVNSHYSLADKYLVRAFVESKGYSKTLANLIGVYKDSSEIDFDSLPSRFAIKLNFGAGFNIIVPDKSKLVREDVCKKLDLWMSSGNYSNAERHYNLIDRRILIEEFIDDGTGGFPLDYKFMCINGKVHCVLAVSNRGDESGTCFSPYDLQWNYLENYDKAHTSKVIRKPRNLNEMIEMAEQLSKGLGVVRIDLYSDGHKIWFGEITLTPAGCIMHRWSQAALDEMGKLYYETK